MKKITLPILFTLIISACSTPYQSVGLMGGVKVTRIDDNVFQVNSITNGYTSLQTEREYALRKAAETSLELNCTYFAAIDNSSQSFDAVPQNVTSGLVTLSNGQTVYISSSGTKYRLEKPASNSTFVCFNEKPNAVLPGLVYKAQLVIESFKK